MKLRFILLFALLCLVLSLPARAQYELYEFSLIAETGGTFTGFSANPAINNAGTVAFRAGLRAGGNGVFTGADPLANRVIGTGDALFGSAVTGLSFGNEGLNDAGQLAFRASLADGRQVIGRANVIPEPGTLALLAGIAVPGMGVALRRRPTRR